MDYWPKYSHNLALPETIASNFWLYNPPYDAPRKNKLLKANGKGWPRCIDWKIHAILSNERNCTHETTTRLIWIDVTITIWGTWVYLVYISCMYTNGTQDLLVYRTILSFFPKCPWCSGSNRSYTPLLRRNFKEGIHQELSVSSTCQQLSRTDWFTAKIIKQVFTLYTHWTFYSSCLFLTFCSVS